MTRKKVVERFRNWPWTQLGFDHLSLALRLPATASSGATGHRRPRFLRLSSTCGRRRERARKRRDYAAFLHPSKITRLRTPGGGCARRAYLGQWRRFASSPSSARCAAACNWRWWWEARAPIATSPRRGRCAGAGGAGSTGDRRAAGAGTVLATRTSRSCIAVTSRAGLFTGLRDRDQCRSRTGAGAFNIPKCSVSPALSSSSHCRVTCAHAAVLLDARRDEAYFQAFSSPAIPAPSRCCCRWRKRGARIPSGAEVLRPTSPFVDVAASWPGLLRPSTPPAIRRRRSYIRDADAKPQEKFRVARVAPTWPARCRAPHRASHRAQPSQDAERGGQAPRAGVLSRLAARGFCVPIIRRRRRHATLCRAATPSDASPGSRCCGTSATRPNSSPSRWTSKWRGKGIGVSLMRALFDDLMMSPAKPLFLEVAADSMSGGAATVLQDGLRQDLGAQGLLSHGPTASRLPLALVMARDLGVVRNDRSWSGSPMTSNP